MFLTMRVLLSLKNGVESWMLLDLDFSLIQCLIILATAAFILLVCTLEWNISSELCIVLDLIIGGDGGAHCFLSFPGFPPNCLQWDFK